MSPRILRKRHLMFDRTCPPRAAAERFKRLYGHYPVHIVYPERHVPLEPVRAEMQRLGVEIIGARRVTLYAYAGPIED